MTDQLTTARDQIAEMCGWKYEGPETNCWVHAASGTETRWGHHPVPDSLDFVSRATSGHWQYALFPYGIYGTDHNERLLVAFTTWAMYLRNLRDNDRPAFDAACEKIRKECGK